MKSRILPALTAGLVMLAATHARAADPAFISAEGEYVWNPQASHYPEGTYATEQTMSIKHDDGKTITLSQDVHLKGGMKVDWNYDGAYDGQPHHGDWITIALKRIKPNAFSNDYVMNDGTKGHEVATITKNRITIRGASFDAKGGKHPYVEVWDKTS